MQSERRITENGAHNGKLVGIITERDFRLGHCSKDATVGEYMTPLKDLVVGQSDITLDEANDLIWKHKINQLPIVDKNGNLQYLIFRKDYEKIGRAHV